jgi:hypothetical protein
VYTPSAADRLFGEEPKLPRILAMGDGEYFRWLAAQGTLSPRRLSRLSAVIKAYADVNCHAISVAGQRERGVDADLTWTFGESPLFVAHDLLQRARARRSDVFVDVGSACGRIVLGMQAVHGFRAAVGIEGLATSHRLSREKQRQLRIPNVHLLRRDIERTDFSFATLLFCFGTCFAEEDLHRWFSRAAPGARVVTATHPLGRGFRLMHEADYVFV